MSSNSPTSDRSDSGPAGPETTLSGFLGYALKRAFNAIHANLVLTLRPFDLRMVTYSALVIIVERPGMRQAQLADALGIDRPNAVAIVDELVTRNLISRERVPKDRRAYALNPTPEGRDLCARAVAADHACEAQIKAGLSPERVQLLIADLRAIERTATAVHGDRAGH